MKLIKNARENKDIILNLWSQVASNNWNYKMLAEEVGLSHASVQKMIKRARSKGDSRAVPYQYGRSPW